MKTINGEQLEVAEKDKETISEREDVQIHEVVVDMFNSLVPQNIVNALATDSLLAVLVTAVVIGHVIKPGGALMRAVEEVEVIIMRVITVLIHLAPIGIFFLILPNLSRLNIGEIGMSLGIPIGGNVAGMVLHLFILSHSSFSSSRVRIRILCRWRAILHGLRRGVLLHQQLRSQSQSDVNWSKEYL